MALAESSDINPVLASVLPWQQPVVEQLVALKKQGKLPHGLLVELQTSVDSIAFGWYLVSALLCDSSEHNLPCGECKSCQLMQANNYPDFTYTTLQESDKTHKLNRDIKIDQIRRLIHQINLTNTFDAGKYALIYPAEKMNQSAANSLLKTLEEPSDKSTLILLTHHSARLPITIRSRCQKWSINKPAQADAISWLQSKGMEQGLIDQYLSLARQDAQLALQMFQQEFHQDYQTFSQLLPRFFNNQIDAATVFNGIKSMNARTLSNIFQTEIMRYVNELLTTDLSQALKSQLVDLLDLQRKADWVLSVEDNNLNLQLQLEDVLISMKQIINRG
jgi:DNA polymerase III delta prime subunit